MMVSTRPNRPTSAISGKPISTQASRPQTIKARLMVIWKFSASLPCWSTKGSRSFFSCQTISGPITLPIIGARNQANAA